MKDIQCKKCAHFTPEWCEFKRDSLDPDLMRDCEYYKAKTNADRIRSMTDEELAEWITKIEFKGRTLGWSVNSPTPSMLTDYWLYWLKQEADE